MDFKCDTCGVKSYSNSDLTMHVRRKHTNEKPFECTICPYKNATTSNLYSHIRKMHKKDLVDNPDYKRFCQKRQREKAGDSANNKEKNGNEVEQNTSEMEQNTEKVGQCS